jgi:hypothetical protein
MSQPGAYIESGAAQQQMDQVDQGLQDAQKLQKQIDDSVHQMVSGPWQGPRAQKFGQQFQQHADDFGHIVQQLNQIVETAKQNQGDFVNSEQ